MAGKRKFDRKELHNFTEEELLGLDATAYRNVDGNLRYFNSLKPEVRQKWVDRYVKAAEVFDVDPAILLGKFGQETTFGKDIKPTGVERADGPSQVSRAAYKDIWADPDLRKKLQGMGITKVDDSNYMDHDINPALGAAYMVLMKGRYKDASPADLLSAYNQRNFSTRYKSEDPKTVAMYERLMHQYASPIHLYAHRLRKLYPELNRTPKPVALEPAVDTSKMFDALFGTVPPMNHGLSTYTNKLSGINIMDRILKP